MLLGMLGGSSLGNLLAGKRVKQAFDGETGTSCGEWGTPRSIRLNGFYLRNYLSKIKDRVFIINLD